jgi:hypothetical protein
MLTMKRLRVSWRNDPTEGETLLGILLSSPGAYPIFHVGGPYVDAEKEAHDLIASDEGYEEIIGFADEYGIYVEYLGTTSTLEALEEVRRFEEGSTT